MNPRLPTREEILQLTAFLPRLQAPGFQPVVRWGGGARAADGAISMPWPEYDEVVGALFRAASAAPWCDYNYQPTHAGRMANDPQAISQADLAQVRTMLTWCVRGERFCDGHWLAVLERGTVQRLLVRLTELAAQE